MVAELQIPKVLVYLRCTGNPHTAASCLLVFIMISFHVAICATVRVVRFVILQDVNIHIPRVSTVGYDVNNPKTYLVPQTSQNSRST